MRQFVGIDSGPRAGIGRDHGVEAPTYWKSPLGGNILEAENLYLDGKGLRITRIVDDATIIHAPSSTKNWEQKRDGEMHQTGEGKQWYFGMRAHGGVKPVIVASVCRFIALRAFT